MSKAKETYEIKKVNPIAKYLVLVVLFALPLVAYLFFLQGKHHFDTLPVMREQIGTLDGFVALDGSSVQLKDSVSVITFLGNQPYSRLGYVSNINEKIYKEFHEFETFQMISIIPKSGVKDISEILFQMQETTDIEDWHFITASDEEINSFFQSLNSGLPINADLSSDYAFITDKNKALRGRPEDDEDVAVYGYDTSSIATLQKKMIDDMRVLLAEYRFAFKKNRDEQIKNDE
ncbi:membrane or secreted protein [Nonlabens antarcticus]|uniref:membrane or secreted protein n=1 Tax=Nonlabens antarcticus TaxID=392714 RepID=UPI001891E6A8|nr:membrane or secreted protein [Nonlabens antarcticus]